ncbi:monofunctional biosynthetic peptidoglycan transglycosylase [Acidiluteibacter ferrifornacis]|uniref:Biosynthetic peptidoglycan transglycosylase n=1 Tax=Acidiluteibacter ferrifornacis TaxID=2692424 RepID=A0A6N9NLS3_9FLAO|nr:monofunctional biosynthetic peptidoglycan transglycosylase [Acidiluteibacter ferrifornacis]NBG66077.1 monofunctional biosynthetic peptidoglycan transglycosylase [Acidiluteibacter ferrifornacis]
MFKKIFKWIGRLLLLFFGSTILTVVVYRFVNPPITPFMIAKYFEGGSKQIQKDWVPIESMSPDLPLAVIAAEDQKFMTHNGFDVEAIEKAIKNNQKGKKVRGASTISQQTAKNVFLVPSRSWVRKGLETYFTFLIEVIWSKKRIMEVYLNVIEQGDGIYGVQASAIIHFNKDALKVSRSQAALMAVVLPNPVKFKIKNPSPYVRGRQSWTIRQMSNLGGQSVVKSFYED